MDEVVLMARTSGIHTGTLLEDEAVDVIRRSKPIDHKLSTLVDLEAERPLRWKSSFVRSSGKRQNLLCRFQGDSPLYLLGQTVSRPNLARSPNEVQPQPWICWVRNAELQLHFIRTYTVVLIHQPCMCMRKGDPLHSTPTPVIIDGLTWEVYGVNIGMSWTTITSFSHKHNITPFLPPCTSNVKTPTPRRGPVAASPTRITDCFAH